MTTLAKASVARPAKQWATPLFTLALVGLALAQPSKSISTDPRRLFGLNRATRVEGADVGRP